MIKSPPKTTFMKQLHKLSRPFFNEVSFYLELMHQLTLAEETETRSPLERILPVCFHAYSSYYANNEGTGTWYEDFQSGSRWFMAFDPKMWLNISSPYLPGKKSCAF